MKKLLLIMLLTAGVQLAGAQHMHREAGDNCMINNQWYQVTDVCTGQGESQLRCDYCGLYFNNRNARISHQATCKYRPHIEYDYDNAGNRTERDMINYHWGTRVTAFNSSQPEESRRTNGLEQNVRILLAIKTENQDFAPKKEQIA